MTPLIWLILASVALGAGALALFLWSLRSGQYEDLEGAAQRILYDED
jgi:cbb3-type cytochrome oxidase maturation protein